MTWGAFICIDLQLFLGILPLTFFIYRCNKTAAIVFLVVLVIIGTIITGFMIWYYKLLPGYLFTFDTDMIQAYGINILTKIDSYAFGILMAFIY
jgi:hypothetical protein